MSSPGACAPWAQQPVWALQPLAGFLPAPFPSLSKLTRWTQACPHHVPYCPGGTGVHSCRTSGALGPEDGPWGLQPLWSEAWCSQMPGLSLPCPFCSARVQLEQDGRALATAAQATGLAPVPLSLGPDFQCLCLLSWS